MLMYNLCKSKTKEVRKILSKILNYFEFVYFSNYDKEKYIKQLQRLTEETGLRYSYLDMKVKLSNKNYSYVSYSKRCVYLTKEDLLSDDFEIKIVTICIIEFLKKALEYVKEENIKNKYISFYKCLLELKIIPSAYKGILSETDIIASYIAENVVNY